MCTIRFFIRLSYRLMLLLLLLSLLAGCQKYWASPPAGQGLPTEGVPPTEAVPPTVEAYPPPQGWTPGPTDTPEPTSTPEPTETPLPPTPTPIQPTPFAPAEALPENFPTVVYLVQRLRPPSAEGLAPVPLHPLQIWTLHYEGGMLREELVVDLQPEILAAQGIPEGIGYARALHLLPSPDGKMLALSVEAGYPPAAVLILQLDGSVLWLRDDKYPPIDVFGWTPDGSRILVRYMEECGLMDIIKEEWSWFPYDCEGIRIDCEGASVSPDGRYAFYAGGSTRLARVEVNIGSVKTLLPDKPASASFHVANFAWSPDGKQAIFTWDKTVQVRYGEGQLWLMDADGSNMRPLGRDDTYDFYPAWSPDGRTIAFARRENPPEDLAPISDPTALVSSLYLLDVESGKERLLLSSEGQYAHWDPEWLPDGSGLVFLSDRGGEANLYFIRPDGTGLQQLTHQGGLTGEIAVLKKGGK